MSKPRADKTPSSISTIVIMKFKTLPLKSVLETVDLRFLRWLGSDEVETFDSEQVETFDDWRFTVEGVAESRKCFDVLCDVFGQGLPGSQAYSMEAR